MFFKKERTTQREIKFADGETLNVERRELRLKAGEALAVERELRNFNRVIQKMERLGKLMDDAELSIATFDKLNAEYQEWEAKAARIVEISDSISMQALVSWEYYEQEGDKTPLPVTLENLETIDEGRRIQIAMALLANSMKGDEEGKKLDASLPEGSPTQTAKPAKSQTSTLGIELPESTDNVPVM